MVLQPGVGHPKSAPLVRSGSLSPGRSVYQSRTLVLLVVNAGRFVPPKERISTLKRIDIRPPTQAMKPPRSHGALPGALACAIAKEPRPSQLQPSAPLQLVNPIFLSTRTRARRMRHGLGLKMLESVTARTPKVTLTRGARCRHVLT